MLDRLALEADRLAAFLQTGGPVLWAIFALAALIGTLAAERALYLHHRFPAELRRITGDWPQSRPARRRLARYRRTAILSACRARLGATLPVLRVLVTICPLLGLLGTVTGMVQIFDTLAIAGTGHPRALAAGISRATLPTMAGMLVALPGLYACHRLEQAIGRALERLADRLPLPA